MPDAKTIQKLKRRQSIAKGELIVRVKKAQVRIAKKIQGLRPNDFPVWDKKFRDSFFGQVGSHYEVIGKELDAWGKELAGKTAVDFHKSAITDIKSLTGKAVKGSTLRFSRARVNRYWEIIHPDNTQHLAAVFTNKMAATDIRALRSAFLDTYRQRSLESWSQAEFHKRLYSAWEVVGGNLGSHKFVDAAGRPWANDRYLSMLTRTTTARVARDSYIDTLVQNGDDLARIGPSGDSCPICRRWIGVIVSISGKDPKYPSYSQTLGAGMWHPNCDCLMSRMDETVHAEEIEKQAESKNVDWNDPKQMNRYRKSIGLPTVESPKGKAPVARIPIPKPKPKAKAKRKTPMTAIEASQALVDDGIAKTADLSRLDDVLAVDIHSTLKELTDEFKSWTERLTEGAGKPVGHKLLLVATGERRANVYAFCNPITGAMNFNASGLMKDAKTFGKGFSNDIAAGFHPPVKAGVSYAKAITTHEFGHALLSKDLISGSRAMRMKPDPLFAEIKSIKRKYTRQMHKMQRLSRSTPGPRPYQPDLPPITEAQVAEGKAWMKKNYISGYGEKNLDEFVAEAFTMARLSPDPSPFALRVYDIIKKGAGR